MPSDEITRALKDSSAVLRRRLLLHDGAPVELSWSYYPCKIEANTPLASTSKISGGAPKALANLGHPQRSFVDRLSARLPTTEELELLELPDDVPVIRQLRVIHSGGELPVEASILSKGAHRYELLYRESID